MNFLLERNIPRWIIFSIDIVICLCSLMVAYLLRFNFAIPQAEISTFYFVFPSVLITRIISFLVFKTYSGIIRYTSTRDSLRILITLASGTVFLGFSNFVSYQFTEKYVVPFSILIIDFFVAVFAMVAGRLAVKVAYNEITNPSSEKSNVIIYGAGESGVITKRTLDRDAGTKFKVLAFVDDDEKKVGRKLEGISIYDAKDDLEKLLTENIVKHLIISIQRVNAKRKAEIIDACLKYNTKVLNVPPVRSWINGALSFKQIKTVKIDELLEREAIQLDLERIRVELEGKIILITGGAGSIGSEIARQVLNFNPQQILMLDAAESPLYALQLELNDFNTRENIEPIIADIRNEERMRQVFEKFHPQVVFHAAAYKHVPMMEENPTEAIRTNVAGTCLVANLADEFKVKNFVMLSTDKAVNPTNIMGASKRIAEIYIQALNKISETKFITTRFGNVLGSNGSVIPIFKKQIEEGKIVTVTHPDITRYFMTIPEACQLVLEAGVIGNGGEIFIFDMGIPVKISDLAKKMIMLSGLQLGKDIKIEYTGLRPGEKLYEELLNDKENTLPTHHHKILIAKVHEYEFAQIKEQVSELITLLKSGDNFLLVKKMKNIVPEFISNNSVYEKLDVVK
ncbi:MAG: nucleoside-diphosphate sugar epimerase/dehydratase [Bacteroidia bacterium]